MANTTTLLELLPQLDEPINSLSKDPSHDKSWARVEELAKLIADGLRTKSGNVDNHTQLGESSLPQSLASLLKFAVSEEQTTPVGASAKAVYELLRVGANICMDHDANRQRLLDAGYPTSVVALLQAYARSSKAIEPNDTLVTDLKIMKTAIGVLLNASMGFEPVKSVLIASEAPLTILQLSTTYYPPGEWARFNASNETDGERLLSSWEWRSGLSNWSWRALGNFMETDEEEPETAPSPIFDSEALPWLIIPLRGFMPPFSPTISEVFTLTTRSMLIKTDLDVLEEVCMSLESLILDSDSARMALAKSIDLPNTQSSLRCILEFVERGSHPPYWNEFDDKQRSRWEKTLGLCKAALIKAVITMAGDEKSMEVLWDKESGTETFPGGWFIQTMYNWVKAFSTLTNDSEGVRDDLTICGTLSLGNLARTEVHCKALVQPPISIIPDLIPLIGRDVDIKIKHGAMGLLKNLAQAPANKVILGEAGIIEALSISKIWEKGSDLAEVVQISAIGVAKHLCNSNLKNTMRLVLSPSSLSPNLEGAGVDSGLDQIIDLVKRSETLALQSEGTRVLVNVVRSLWTPNATSSANGVQASADRRRECIEKLANLDTTEPLTEMLGRSAKYPILLNEAVVALTLLGSHPSGAVCVLQSLTEKLPFNLNASGIIVPSSSPSSTPVNMLVTILENPDKTFPPELRTNVCSLLTCVGKITESATGENSLSGVKAAVEKSLRNLANSTSEHAGDKMLKTASQKTLDTWSSIP